MSDISQVNVGGTAYSLKDANAARLSHTHTKANITDFAHTHGNITNDGKIGTASGYIVATTTDGVVTTNTAAALGLETVAGAVTGSGAINATLADNKEYTYTGVTSLTMTGASDIECFGFITFSSATSHTVTLTGFTAVKGDDITAAGASTMWEFSLKNGCIIFKNWSA